MVWDGGWYRVGTGCRVELNVGWNEIVVENCIVLVGRIRCKWKWILERIMLGGLECWVERNGGSKLYCVGGWYYMFKWKWI